VALVGPLDVIPVVALALPERDEPVEERHEVVLPPAVAVDTVQPELMLHVHDIRAVRQMRGLAVRVGVALPDARDDLGAIQTGHAGLVYRKDARTDRRVS